jgi:hypothetical protein
MEADMKNIYSIKNQQSTYLISKQILPLVTLFLLLFIFVHTEIAFTQNLLDEPESIVYDAKYKRYLVSNVGHGKIIQIDSSGTYSIWNEDQASIRGLVSVDRKLFAACDAGVAVFDLETAQKITTIAIVERAFLNDITADTLGFVYVNDNGNGNMYKIDVQGFSYWIFTQGLIEPNGVLYDVVNNRLLTSSWEQNGRIQAVSLDDSTVTTILQTTFAFLDGMAYDYAGNFYVASWGENMVFRYDHDITLSPVAVSSGHSGPADIFINQEENLLVVPNFNRNTVDFIDLSQDLTTITVTPNEVTLSAGDKQQFFAEGLDAIGNKIKIEPTWSATGGTINSEAIYTATKVGHFTISATVANSAVIGHATLHINPGSLARIDITPSETTIVVGNQQQFRANGYDGYENEVSIIPNWSSGGGGTINEDGLFTATSVGDYTITVSVTGESTTRTASVHVIPGGLERIEVIPADVNLTAGEQQQFTATGYDAYDNQVPFSPIWLTEAGTIDENGLYYATVAGDFFVIAVVAGGTITDTAKVQVETGALSRIDISPTETNLNFGDQQQFTASGFDDFENEVTFAPNWSTTGGTIDGNGLFTANEVGDFTVTATDTTTSTTGTANVSVISTGVGRRSQKPIEFVLFQNYPNPFNPETTIEFSVKEKCFVQLDVFDIIGRKVTNLISSDFDTGYYRVTFDAKNLASGVYIFQIKMKDFVDVKKMILLE